MVEAGITPISLVAVLILIVAPLIAYLWKRGQSIGRVFLLCLAMTALWYVSQSTMHQASHMLGFIASGAPASSLQAIPHSWEGFYARTAEGPGLTGTHWQRLIQLAAPFLIDGILIILGGWLFQWRHQFPAFAGGLIMTLTYLHALYDLVNNYIAGVFENSGDYQQLLSGYPPLVVHAITLALILLGLFGCWSEIGRARPTD